MIKTYKVPQRYEVVVPTRDAARVVKIEGIKETYTGFVTVVDKNGYLTKKAEIKIVTKDGGEPIILLLEGSIGFIDPTFKDRKLRLFYLYSDDKDAQEF